MAISHKVFSSRVLNVDSTTYVGEAGRLFYAQTTATGLAPVLKYSDGVTPGGLPLSGGSLTFSSDTPPLNPTDGILWWNVIDGRLYIYYDGSWVDASPDVQGAVTEIIAGEGISINTSTGAVTITATGGTGNGYTGSQGTTGYVGSQGINGYTGSQGMPTDLTNYATTTYVTTRGYITADIFTTTNISTFINDAHYIQDETGVNSVVGTANQVIVNDLGGRNIQLSTPQNLNTTATVQFGDLTVQNISILGTGTNLLSDIVQGYRLYLASSATNLSQVNGGGVQLGNTATGVHSIFWNADGYWDTDGDGIKTLTLQATTSTLGTLEVLNQARFGYVNQDLTLANAYIQVDSNTNNFSQIAIVNHNTGTSASADIVATNDTGNDSTGFIDMGINSSVFSTSSWTVNGANDGYLYVAGGSLAIGTDQVDGEIKTFVGALDSPTIISVANASTITYSVDLMPSVDAAYYVGKPGLRWKGVYVGTGSVWIQDISLGTDAELTVDNGVLYINGAYQLQVGQLKFFENTIESTTGGTDIQIGLTTSTANLILNRNVILATGKTLGLQDQLSPFTTSTLSVIGGILTVSNAAGLQAGQIKINNNVIESTTGGTDIQIGLTTSTANLVLNRNTVIATGKSLVFGTGSLQTVAWNSTATVHWDQITGAPNVTGYTGSAGTNGTNGYTGSFGTTGYTGSAGTNGTNGYTGSFGTTGYTGSFGTTGYTGSKGVADVYVSSITAGTGTQVSTSTGAVTIWVVPQTITTTATTTASNLTVDFSGPSFIAWQPSANGARTITLSGFTPGRKVEMFITPHTTNDIFTVSGVTTSQCSNGKNTFTMNGVGASQQTSFILQFYCTTNAIGGVWIYGNGTL